MGEILKVLHFLKFTSVIFLLSFASVSCAQVEVGAKNTSLYLNDLKGKNVALIVNQTSVIDNQHLVDTLFSLGVTITTIFAPEHGFRGKADAGEHIQDSKDKKTGIPIISLYGKNKKPKKEQLENIDIVVFDVQDVGARFYTYLSTMHYAMEACAENNVDLIILDRPNPNGWYIDGPVLDTSQVRSFVGMHPIPIVHGMTLGELALMINGEGWLRNHVKCKLKVITCENYDHTSKYSLPIKPSPNLPNDLSINLYPSLCLFEATNISVGRGTHDPFQVFGAPTLPKNNYSFTPESIPGMSKHPKHENITCYGSKIDSSFQSFNLDLLLEVYKQYNDSASFFTSPSFFNKLAGNTVLINQIKNNESAVLIRKSWKERLDLFKSTREKYLLYPDFN